MKVLKIILHFCHLMKLIGMILVLTALNRLCGGGTVDIADLLCGTLLWLIGQIMVNMTKYIVTKIERGLKNGKEHI